MIEHAWTLLCSKCITDPDSRNATLVEVLEQINVPSGLHFPAIAPIPMDLVSVWYRSNPNQAARGMARVTVFNPDGEAGTRQEYAIDLTEFYRSRMVSRSGGMALSGPGVYFFLIEFRDEGQEQWRNAARIPLNVVAQISENPQAHGPG